MAKAGDSEMVDLEADSDLEAVEVDSDLQCWDPGGRASALRRRKWVWTKAELDPCRIADVEYPTGMANSVVTKQRIDREYKSSVRYNQVNERMNFECVCICIPRKGCIQRSCP